MRRAGQTDRASSASEAAAEPDDVRPPARRRPLSDVFPLQGRAEQGDAAGGHPEVRPHPSSRIMKLFSSQRSCPIPDGPPAPGVAPNQARPGGFTGLGVTGSFKKLRSSVLQGIQIRGTANQGVGDSPAANRDECNGVAAASDPGPGGQGGYGAANGAPNGQLFAAIRRYSSDNEEEEEEEEEEEGKEDGGLQRNKVYSRSIRKAYGAGRIPLLDTGHGKRPAGLGSDFSANHGPAQGPGPEVNLRSAEEEEEEEEEEGVNGNTPSGLSKSADNLHLFKRPFRRKAASPAPRSPSPQPPGTPRANGVQRTASTPAAPDQRGRSPGRRKSPLRAKGHMLKLVGSVTDLTVRRRPSPSPGPAPGPSPSLSPLSRLHDDYSRRTPCLPAGDRRRRPSPARSRSATRPPSSAVSPDRPPETQTRAEDGSAAAQHRVLISPQPAEASGGAVPHPLAPGLPVSGDTPSSSPRRAPLGDGSTPGEGEEAEEEEGEGPGDGQDTGRDAPPLVQPEPCRSHSQERTARPEETTADLRGTEALLQAEESSFPSGSGTPPLLPTPASPPATVAGSTPASTETASSSSVNPRRRAGRAKPRPISDYGQLVSRKYSVPKEEAELLPEERTTNGTPRRDYKSNGGAGETDGPEGCGANGDVQRGRRRPISVIGGEELFSSPSAGEREDRLPPLSRPPVPSHQVPPYRAVSARLRPCALSQSTPIGLDRLGRRRLHRVLSDEVSGGSAALDDSVSEEDGSFDELTDVTTYLQPGVELSALNEWISLGQAVYAEALWDHVTMEEQELAFTAGEVIRVLDASHKDWWWGRGGDREAWFPSSFVRVRVNQEEDSSEECVESALDPNPAPRDPHSTQHREQMRTNVVKEIMNTERIYIKHLRDICEGYIRQCRKHPDMFTEPQLRTIFSNIEDIYKFHRQFLRDLEKNYDKEQPHLSQIGSCFLLQGEGFSIYSEYCNTHPAASAELQRLMKLSRYKHFFEACRLLQQMIDISIAGFLLTPVQKICKYPLQLGELLKYTPKDHSDHGGVSDAYQAMKNVASLINERKRRLESVDAIAHWQVAILRWEGADVLERSSELIHSGELTRVVRHGKTQQRSFFLFDHQLVFCKKDVLRRDLLHYRGRLDTDRTELVDLADGRDPLLGLSLRNALRLRDAATLESQGVLCCRKPQDKQRWLEAFARERRRVKEDQEMGMEISEAQRKQAVFNARKSKQGKTKTIGYAASVPPHPQALHPIHQRHVTVPTSVPQQQVFSLAEPKRKPSHLWYTFTRNPFFKK